MSEIKEIGSIEFGIMSKEEILRLSVADIYKNRLCMGKENYNFVMNGLYDPRMGPMEKKVKCVTCGHDSKTCNGHFGSIRLNIEVIHPLYYRTILSFLKCFCINCSRLLITEHHIQLWNLTKQTKEFRFNSILKRIIKLKFCLHCNMSQPKFTLSTHDGVFIASFKNGPAVEKLRLSTTELCKILNNIIDDDVRLLGFEPTRMHPKNFILSVLPVLPPRSRPYIVNDNMISDDDITISLCEIIKANNNLNNEKISDAKREKYIQTLKFRIKTMFDNTGNKAKHTNSRPLKGIKERLCGKEGLVRSNLLGKRVDFSARTVIGPDPTLRGDEIAVPPQIAETLTFPEHVFEHNKDWLQEMIWTGDVPFIQRNGRRIHMKYALKSSKRDEVCTLIIGDIAHRKLMNGDYMLLNRQPTLHRGSMLGMKIIIREGKSIRLALNYTAALNADFDGDESNLFSVASQQSRIELESIASVKYNMIGPQSSVPLVSIVQDPLLASYMMTKNTDELDRDEFFQMCMACREWTPGYIKQKLQTARDVYTKFGKDVHVYSGKTLFSLLFPDDFNYQQTNNAMEDEPTVKVYKGILYEGAINKSNLKSTHSSIILYLHKEYSEDVAMDFVSNVQFLATEYMNYHGFTVGISDCIIGNGDGKQKIHETVTRCFVEARTHIESTNNVKIQEIKVSRSLNKAKDVGMRLAKESLPSTNNFISTVTSGAKGDYFNIAQIMGLLGQQSINGNRIKKQLNNGTRVLPHYSMKTQLTDFEEYESQGFITNSFVRGLNPKEFWNHCCSGRQGIIDTSMKTASSGYMQRKCVKIMEDMQVKYDQTVRNSVGSIIQFSYGGDNLDPTRTILKDGVPQICDVDRLVDQMNTRYELERNII